MLGHSCSVSLKTRAFIRYFDSFRNLKELIFFLIPVNSLKMISRFFGLPINAFWILCPGGDRAACPGPVDCSALTAVATDFEGLLAQPASPRFKGALIQIHVSCPGFAGSDKSRNGHRYDTMPIANGVINAGMSCQLVHYCHEEHEKFMDICQGFDFLIIRCKPGQIDAAGGDQAKFDAGIRDIRAKGVQVWPSPEVAEKMQGSDAVCKIARVSLGMKDTFAYHTSKEMMAGFKKTMAFRPRMIKTNNSSFVWIVKLKDGNYCHSFGERLCEDFEMLVVTEARRNHEEECSVKEFIEICVNGHAFECGEVTRTNVGPVIDQRFCPSSSEGELRYNYLGSTLVDIVHKRYNQKGTGDLTRYEASEPRLADLTQAFSKDLENLMPALDLADEPLPLWWTATFINAAPLGSEDSQWLLREVSAPRVMPIPCCLAACCTEDNPTASWKRISSRNKEKAKQHGDQIGAAIRCRMDVYSQF